MAIDENKPPSFFDRAITAVIAPIVFNFCVLTTIAFWSSFLPRGLNFLFLNRFHKLYFLPGQFLLAASIIFPLIAGFVLGMSRFADLVGIFFPFGSDDNPKYIQTIIAWLLLTSYAYLYAKILS